MRFLYCALLLFFCLATSSQAEPVPFSPGFVETTLRDPSSGLPVQLKIRRKPGAPWLVLVHGLGQQAAHDWLPLLPALAEDYQLLLFDLPGFGHSMLPDAALTPKKYAELLHYLVGEFCGEPVFVLGHSLGGAIALRYSHDYPQEVRRLLLIDAAGLLQTAVFARHLSLLPRRITGAPILDPLVTRASRVLNFVSGRVQDMLADHALTFQSLASSDQARELLYKENSNINAALGLVSEDFSPVIRQLQTPVWMLWGEQDPVAPLRSALALQWLLPAAQLTILPQVGHVPMSEASLKTATWILQSLQAPVPLPVLETLEHGASQGDGHCKDQDNLVFRGRWRTVTLEHCANIRIENASLERLQVFNSSVIMQNVQIDSKGIAIEAKRANLSATGLSITAAQAWAVENSRIDLAAVHIMALSLGEQKLGSNFFMSLGRWCDGQQEWRLHGVWKPRNGKVDQQFRQVADASCTVDSNAARIDLDKPRKIFVKLTRTQQ